MPSKLDTRGIGLDVGLQFVRWLTGEENLHYGYWDGLDVNAGNVGAAQRIYTEKLFAFLGGGPLRILDIGGGAGETARKLLALGHSVDIVVPSPLLAERCRVNAPGAGVYACKFEDFQTDARYDLCLFSESYQYIPLDRGVPGCLDLLTPEGHIVIADCFRSEGFSIAEGRSTVGGGHLIGDFQAALQSWPVRVEAEVDITQFVAPSVEVEQGLFNAIGYGITRVDAELRTKRPRLRWLVDRLWRVVTKPRARTRLEQRLNQHTRNRTVFAENNVYLMMRLSRA